jgi:hypothetical protein
MTIINEFTPIKEPITTFYQKSTQEPYNPTEQIGKPEGGRKPRKRSYDYTNNNNSNQASVNHIEMHQDNSNDSAKPCR